MPIEIKVTTKKCTIDIRETVVVGITTFESEITANVSDPRKQIVQYLLDFNFTANDPNDQAVLDHEYQDSLKLILITELVYGRGYVVNNPFFLIQIIPSE
jgi:hypothetical protein